MPPKPRIVRFRSKAHLARLRKAGCRQGSIDPHHLTFAQPKGKGLRVSDEFTVPLCRWVHHSATSNDGVHHVGDEAAWWETRGIDPLPIAARLWAESIPEGGNIK